MANAYTRDIPVVVVTGSSVDPEAANVQCVLRKPVTPDNVIAAVERCIASGRSTNLVNMPNPSVFQALATRNQGEVISSDSY